MQLKLRRSQREAGLVSTSVVFCLDARAELTERERYNLSRYKLYDQVIYNSEASRRHLEQSAAANADGTARGGLKAWGHLAMAALRLNLTVRSLERGQHIECKSLEELRDAENAIMQACQNLKAYLETAATFDGSELLIDFSGSEPVIVAQAVRPEPILAPQGAMPVEIPGSPPAGALPAAEVRPAAYDNGPAADWDAVPVDYNPISDAINGVARKLGAVTGLDEQSAPYVTIGGAVLLLVLLVAKCHG